MSALGHKPTCAAKSDVRFTPDSDRESGFPHKVMSALPPKADMCSAPAYVCFGPEADIPPSIRSPRQRTIEIWGRQAEQRNFGVFLSCGRLLEVHQKDSPAEAGLKTCGFEDELVADHPAVPIWAADLMRPSATAWSWSYNYRSGHNDGRGAPVATAIPAVGTASAVGSAMEANAASASDGNDQTVLSLITPQRHGLCRDR
jgi:hypothetical protein